MCFCRVVDDDDGKLEKQVLSVVQSEENTFGTWVIIDIKTFLP